MAAAGGACLCRQFTRPLWPCLLCRLPHWRGVQLCQVLDAAEFCRNVHADEEWRRQAQQASSLRDLPDCLGSSMQTESQTLCKTAAAAPLLSIPSTQPALPNAARRSR